MDLDNEELDATQKEKVKNMYKDLCGYMDLYNEVYDANNKLEQVVYKMAYDLFSAKYGRTPSYSEQRNLVNEYRKLVEDDELLF